VAVNFYAGSIMVREVVDGHGKTLFYELPYDEHDWYTWKISADSTAGILDLYIDGTYALTHLVSENVTNRSGLSGLTGRGPEVKYDDFSLDSALIPTPTEDTEPLCSDEIDNDGDGLTDLDDSDCSAFVPLVVSACGDITSITDNRDINNPVYNIVGIGTQCWMGQNMRIGTMLASGTTMPTDNSIIEKWCYDNNSANCDNEGGLYTWATPKASVRLSHREDIPINC
jgi:hypothetical protein